MAQKLFESFLYLLCNGALLLAQGQVMQYIFGLESNRCVHNPGNTVQTNQLTLWDCWLDFPNIVAQIRDTRFDPNGGENYFMYAYQGTIDNAVALNGNITTPNTPVFSTPMTFNDDQYWQFQVNSAINQQRIGRLRNLFSQQCLTSEGTGLNSPITQSTCTDGDAGQDFILRTCAICRANTGALLDPPTCFGQPGMRGFIKGRSSQKCLDLGPGTPGNAVINTCLINADSQVWRWTPSGTGFLINHVSTGFCLVGQAETNSVFINACRDGVVPQQIWNFTMVQTQGNQIVYRIQQVSSGLCLNNGGNNNLDGNRQILFPCVDQDNERWEGRVCT